MPFNEISWTGPEFEHWHKPRLWYLILILISLLLIITALWQGNFLFSVFVAIAAALVGVTGGRAPRMVEYRLTDESLIVDRIRAYLYEQLAGFATHRVDALDDGFSQLVFQRKQRLGSFIKILFPTSRTQEIRHFLNRYLHEIEYQESLTDHLFRWIRF